MCRNPHCSALCSAPRPRPFSAVHPLSRPVTPEVACADSLWLSNQKGRQRRAVGGRKDAEGTTGRWTSPRLESYYRLEGDASSAHAELLTSTQRIACAPAARIVAFLIALVDVRVFVPGYGLAEEEALVRVAGAELEPRAVTRMVRIILLDCLVDQPIDEAVVGRSRCRGGS